ncbi:MAG: hypothetical protein GKR99_14590 [Rhodobacteraceae bacterium]|nr:hypothetical protein [Paracoccaceae bacterium]
MLERRKSIRFLRKNAERTSLFGVVKFAEKNPETFMTLLEPDGHDTSHRLWSLELMAQLYFSGLDGHQGKAVLLDEGLIHRGMSSLATAGTAEDARAYVQTMQFEHALVLVDCSVDLSIERCRNRPGGVPGGYAMEGGHPNPEKFRNFAKLLSAAIDVLQKKEDLKRFGLNLNREGFP